MFKKPSLFLCLVITILIISCKQTKEVEITQNDIKEITDMVWIPGGAYDIVASDGDLMALPHEKPKHPVKVDGITYILTKFKYSDLTINKTILNNSDEVFVKVNIENIGELDGEEVVQLYVKDTESTTWMPHKQLRGFKRILLKKGEKKLVEFKLNASKDLCYYDAIKQSYTVEPGDFEIQIGSSSKNILLRKIISVEN